MGWRFWFTLFPVCLFVFFSSSLRPAALDPAVSVTKGSGLVSARLWIEINTTDKAIKALFVLFVPTGWELKQSVFLSMSKVR